MSPRGKLWTQETLDLVLPLVRSYSLGIVRDFERLRRAGRAAAELRRRLGIDWPVQADHPVGATAVGIVEAAEAKALSVGSERLSRLQHRIHASAVLIDLAAVELAEDIGAGATLRDYSSGRFDFPSVEYGDPIYWCWQPSDGPRVLHWHCASVGCPERGGLSFGS